MTYYLMIFTTCAIIVAAFRVILKIKSGRAESFFGNPMVIFTEIALLSVVGGFVFGLSRYSSVTTVRWMSTANIYQMGESIYLSNLTATKERYWWQYRNNPTSYFKREGVLSFEIRLDRKRAFQLVFENRDGMVFFPTLDSDPQVTLTSTDQELTEASFDQYFSALTGDGYSHVYRHMARSGILNGHVVLDLWERLETETELIGLLFGPTEDLEVLPSWPYRVFFFAMFGLAWGLFRRWKKPLGATGVAGQGQRI